MFKLLAMGLAIIVLNGCAGVHFYSDKDLKVRTGLRYYTAKPYLLVARGGGSTKPIEVSIVYLPDLEKPQYAKHVKGFGKNVFTFTMSDSSILTKMNIETDQDLSDVADAFATVFTTFKETDFKRDPPTTFELYEIDMKNRHLTKVELINSTVAFALASSSVAETAGRHEVDVVLATTTTLTAPISVYVIDMLSGTASPAGTDYTFVTPTRVTFLAGATNGDIVPVTVTIANDKCVESTEDIDLRLRNVVGAAVLGAQIDHQADITDDDAAPCS